MLFSFFVSGEPSAAHREEGGAAPPPQDQHHQAVGEQKQTKQ